jgi:hypothetical protein
MNLVTGPYTFALSPTVLILLQVYPIYSLTYLLVSKAKTKFAKPSVIFPFVFSFFIEEIAKSVLACRYNNNCNFLHTLVPNVKRMARKRRETGQDP